MLADSTAKAEALAAQSTVRSAVTNALSYAVLAAGLGTIFVSAYLVIVSYSSLPHWDLWDTQISFAARGSSVSLLHWLWQQEDQHRLVIPKLFLLADLHWFHAAQKSLLASIFIIQLLHLTLLVWTMRALGGWQGALWRTGMGLAAFCLFCPSQWENFVWGFQTCFVLPGLFTTVSIVGLLLYWISERRAEPYSSSWKFLVLCAVAALGATYSLSNGNLLWPLLVGSALLLRLRTSATLSLAGVGALSTLLYLHHYDRPPGVTSVLKQPIILIKYVSAYFGSSWVPFSGQSNFPSSPTALYAAEFIGIVGLLAFALLLLRLPSYIRASRPFLVQLELTMLFCVATGVITGLARWGFGVVQAFSSHYQTVSLLFWCCLGLLLLAEVSPLIRGAQGSIFMAIAAGLLGVMVLAANFVQEPMERARLRGFGLNAAAMALMTDVPDLDQLRWAYPPRPEYVLSFVPMLREQRLTAFAGTQSLLLGQPLPTAFKLAPSSDCTGRLEAVTIIGGAASPSVRITGWAWDSKHSRPPSEIVATTNGVIAGLGVVGGRRPDVRAATPGISTDYIGFRGYVRNVRSRGSLQVYAILGGSPDSACLFATTKDE